MNDKGEVKARIISVAVGGEELPVVITAPAPEVKEAVWPCETCANCRELWGAGATVYPECKAGRDCFDYHPETDGRRKRCSDRVILPEGMEREEVRIT